MKIRFIKKKMEELGIAGIFLFGSRAQKAANSASDYDFAILLKEIKALYNYEEKNKIYNEIYDILSSQIKKLCNIDIVFAQSADLQFKYHIIKDGLLLYIGDQKIVSEFFDNTIENYADFAPIRREFHDAILQRI